MHQSPLGNRWQLATGPTLVIYSDSTHGPPRTVFTFDPRGAWVSGRGFETIVLAPRGFDFWAFLNAR